MMLHEYLASEFLVDVPMAASPLRRVSVILQLVHAIKHYYWVVNPQALSAIRPRGTGMSRFLLLHCLPNYQTVTTVGS